jgi:hypothetical protein
MYAELWTFFICSRVSNFAIVAFEEGGKKGKRAHELHKGLDADYYGFRDDDDGVLEKAELLQEKKRRLIPDGCFLLITRL